MAIVRVPKTPRGAFNKNRPVSNLLKAQMEHLEAAAHTCHVQSQRRRPRTEGQAAAYIAELTAQVKASAELAKHTTGPRPPLPPLSAPLPAADEPTTSRAPALKRRARRKTTRTTASRSARTVKRRGRKR